MSNGARHALGVVAGLLLPPLIALALWYGLSEASLQTTSSRVSWAAIGVLAAAGVALAFLAGSRLSPVASLLGGLLLTVLGAAPVVEIAWGVQLLRADLLPPGMEIGYRAAGVLGIQLLIGVALLVVSMFPSRWRGRPEPVYSPSYAPMPYRQPDGGPEDATRPMFRE